MSYTLNTSNNIKVGTCFNKSPFLWYNSSESAYYKGIGGHWRTLCWIRQYDVGQLNYLVALVQTNKKPLQSLLTKDQNGVTD